MYHTCTLATAPRQAAQPGTSVRPAGVSRRPYSLATLRSIIATWRKRRCFRRDLEEMAKANPHLIADIGLKRWQVEAELAKPFWQR